MSSALKYARDGLTQDPAVRRAWTSVEQSRSYRTDSSLVGTTDTHRPSYAIAMVADNLMSDRHQTISIHHADFLMIILRVTDIILHPLNNVRERSPASFHMIDGFAL